MEKFADGAEGFAIEAVRRTLEKYVRKEPPRKIVFNTTTATGNAVAGATNPDITDE